LGPVEMRRKIIVKKVHEMFDGKSQFLPLHLAQEFNCAWLKDNESTKGIRKKSIQAVIKRVRYDQIQQIGNFNYEVKWLPEKNCWLHNWTFSAMRSLMKTESRRELS